MIPLGVMGAAHRSGGGLAAAILALSPVGYWKLNETSGTTATDYSGNARNGTYSGSYALGGRNGFVELSGGYIEIADNDAFTAGGSTNGFSIFGLAYPYSPSGARRFIAAKGAGGQYEWAVEIPASSPTALIADLWPLGAGTTNAERADSAISSGAWHGVSTASPLPTANVRQSLYVDSGTALSSTLDTKSDGPFGNGTAPLRIGGRGDGAGPWSGGLGHIAIFRTQLTGTQVAGLMAAARTEGLIP